MSLLHYKKQIILGIVYLLIVLASIEIVSQIVMGKYYDCDAKLIASGIYENYNPEFLKQICYDYQQINEIPIEKPTDNVLHKDDLHSFLEMVNLQNYPLIPLNDSKTVQLEPNQHTPTINIDSDGFRGPEINHVKNMNKFRIFVIGDSTIFGAYSSSDNTTIPGYLQQKFYTLSKNIEVINAGLPGDNSCSQTQRIKDQLISFKPDLIIVYSGWNDLDRPCGGINTERSTRLIIFSDMVEPFSKICPICKSPKFVILSATWIESHIQNVFGNPTSDKNMDKIISDWKNRWKEICYAGKENNFSVGIFLQPILGEGKKPVTKWESQIMSNYPTDTISAYPSMRAALKELGQTCTKTADLTGVFNDVGKTIYYDRGHIGDTGNYLVADKLFALTKDIAYEKISKSNNFNNTSS